MRGNRSDDGRCSKEICEVFEIELLNSKTPVNLSEKEDTDTLFQDLSKRRRKSSHKFNSKKPIVNNGHKPNESNLSQQSLVAWKPLLTPKFVINLFLISSFFFIPIGIILYFTSLNIHEFKHDYTDCNDTRHTNESCDSQLIKNISYNCKCRIFFQEDKFQDETLFVYYMIENFFQNHRRYEKSRDHEQLLGSRAKNYLSKDCEPFRYRKELNKMIKIAPCGSVANSLFNDSFRIYYFHQRTNETIQLNVSKENLAWNSDRSFKFKNPLDFSNTMNPPSWMKNISEIKNSYQNEDLMVWMRSSAFSSFRKLYGRILLDENAELQFPVNKMKDTNFYEFLKQKYEENLEINLTNQIVINKSVNFLLKYRLPKGQYYVDIDYSKEVIA